MFADEEGPAEAAIGYSDQFLEAGVAKLDAIFGDGYARATPQALAAYVAACASNLNAFMTAATMLPDDAFDEALADLDEQLLAELPAPAPRGRPAKPKRGRR
jgi:hypothetical protein